MAPDAFVVKDAAEAEAFAYVAEMRRQAAIYDARGMGGVALNKYNKADAAEAAIYAARKGQ
jgi:hypothetical protein